VEHEQAESKENSNNNRQIIKLSPSLRKHQIFFITKTMHTCKCGNVIKIIILSWSRLSELLQIGAKVFDLLFAPFHLSLLAVGDNVSLKLFQIL